jgi:hypothetical protein
VNVTPLNLSFIQQRTRNMVAWIKVEMICFFSYVQWSIIQAVRAKHAHISPAMLPVFLVCVFGTAGTYLVIIVRGAKNRTDMSAQN